MLDVYLVCICVVCIQYSGFAYKVRTGGDFMGKRQTLWASAEFHVGEIDRYLKMTQEALRRNRELFRIALPNNQTVRLGFRIGCPGRSRFVFSADTHHREPHVEQQKLFENDFFSWSGHYGGTQ